MVQELEKKIIRGKQQCSMREFLSNRAHEFNSVNAADYIYQKSYSSFDELYESFDLFSALQRVLSRGLSANSLNTSTTTSSTTTSSRSFSGASGSDEPVQKKVLKSILKKRDVSGRKEKKNVRFAESYEVYSIPNLKNARGNATRLISLREWTRKTTWKSPSGKIPDRRGEERVLPQHQRHGDAVLRRTGEVIRHRINANNTNDCADKHMLREINNLCRSKPVRKVRQNEFGVRQNEFGVYSC